MNDRRRADGRDAEDRAVAHLRRAGYEIVDRNVRAAGGELDIVARERDTLCFVEVRSRQSARFGTALEAVTPAKRRQLVRVASAYLARHPAAGPVRFDVVGITGTEILLVRDAFRAPGPRR